MPRTFRDRTNERCGKLVARKGFSRNGRYWWVCDCDCGNQTTVAGAALRLTKGGTQSCGCSKDGNPTHGMSGTITHKTWKSMRMRCLNSNDTVFKHYGGRGIKICKRWDRFENFLADMGERPSLKYSLDRIDVNGDYKPSNCRWATVSEQRRNRRDSVLLTYNGIEMQIDDWADKLGLSRSAVRGRYYRGFPVESILSKERFHKSRPIPR